MEPQHAKNGTDGVDEEVRRLASDHEQLLVLLWTLALSTERAVCARAKTLAKLARALRIHMALEEEILLPTFWAASRTADDAVIWAEALAVHDGVKRVFAELSGTDLSTTKFRALSKVLYELLSHHTRQNELELFPRARAVLDDERLDALGARMHRRRLQLEGELIAASKRRNGLAAADTSGAFGCWDEPSGEEETDIDLYISS